MKKIKNGTISSANVSLKTSAKMAVSRCISGALVEGTVLAPLAEKIVDKTVDNAKRLWKEIF